VITHPEKVLFPEDGITKGELASYYEAIAPYMLPHIRGRPVTMERYHRGIQEAGFFQKDVSKGFPEWLERVEVPKKGGTVHHPLANDTRSLVWLANQNSITPHLWTSRVPELYQPDICVFDLDPMEEQPDLLRAAALSLRALLNELGLASWVKTSGSKGFHIVVPLDRQGGFGEVARFAHAAGALLVRRDPEHLTQEFSKSDRGRRILIDTARNGYSATFASVYAVRAKPGAPVSAPCTWEELERGEVAPQTFTLRTMPRRIAEAGDLWSDMLDRGQSLHNAMSQLRQPCPAASPRPGICGRTCSIADNRCTMQCRNFARWCRPPRLRERAKMRLSHVLQMAHGRLDGLRKTDRPRPCSPWRYLLSPYLG
jgi:bifunctional non-homologous end joining protein LigD